MAAAAFSVHFERLAALRAEVRALECGSRSKENDVLPFGIAAIDARFAGGGLSVGALHEVTGTSPDLANDAAATLFVAALAARSAAKGGTVLWALDRRDLFAPGLAQVGLTPDRLLQAECGRDEDVLAVMEEGLRHGGLAAVVGEVARTTMAASRRLQLAAEENGVMALMLRRWPRSGGDPLAMPSTAVTRWRIASAPSSPLPVDRGIGRARWIIELARQRGGEPFTWIVEGADAEGRLALPARPADRPVAPDRQVRLAA